MHRSVCVLVSLLVMTGLAAAQPALTPPVPPPCVQCDAQVEDEIGPGAHVGGVLANAFFGFGIGQAIQGRWTDTGWMFTLGTGVSLGALIVGIEGNGPVAFAGLLGFGVVYGLGIYDAAVGPSRHNARVRAARMRMPPLTPYVGRAPNNGSVAGLTLRF